MSVVHNIFERCTKAKILKDGSLRISCILGLWSVEGLDRDFIRKEAMHYWIQYYDDGEYGRYLEQHEKPKNTK